MDAGGVGDLRRVKSAMAVAKGVLQHTKHTLLVGDQATAFALNLGFIHEPLSTNVSLWIWETWQENNCQPNFWKVHINRGNWSVLYPPTTCPKRISALQCYS